MKLCLFLEIDNDESSLFGLALCFSLIKLSNFSIILARWNNVLKAAAVIIANLTVGHRKSGNG